jgi:hypothetical protein
LVALRSGSARLFRVKDEERRGHVVKWMQNIGEPWTKADKTPTLGSALAANDKAKPSMSSVASYGNSPELVL